MKYAKNNALAGHTFGSIVDQNDHLLDWEVNIAEPNPAFHGIS